MPVVVASVELRKRVVEETEARDGGDSFIEHK
jgi:hypothetical protein